jgi:hypothetical protein
LYPSAAIGHLGEISLLFFPQSLGGACGSVVVKALCSGLIPDEVNFSIYLILQAALGSGVYSASNRNEYQKHKNNNVSGD